MAFQTLHHLVLGNLSNIKELGRKNLKFVGTGWPQKTKSNFEFVYLKCIFKLGMSLYKGNLLDVSELSRKVSTLQLWGI